MKTFVALLLAALAVAASCDKIRYNGYKVKRVTPNTEAHLEALKGLESLGASFWHEPSTVGRHADVMLPPHIQEDLVQGMQSMGMDVSDFVEDVQALIDQEEDGTQAESRLSWNAYASVQQINDFLVEQNRLHPSKTELFSIGKSYEGRDLWVLKIATGGEANKKAIWLDANIHAREWITSAVSTYLTNELLNGGLTDWTRDFDWYILNVFNPDGLQYSKTSDRMWRKTRSPGGSCRGADANRNFGFHWMEGGASSNPCSETYGGSRAFSESETAAVRDYITNTLSKKNLVAYISLHSYSQLILLPFGHNNKRIPQYNFYMDLGRRIATATASKYGTRFTPGNIVDLLYVASGGSMDWVKGTYNTNLTLTYELRDTGRYGFILPPAQIIPSSVEFIDGLAVAIAELRAGIITPEFPGNPPARQVEALKPHQEHHTFGHMPHRSRRVLSPLPSFERY